MRPISADYLRQNAKKEKPVIFGDLQNPSETRKGYKDAIENVLDALTGIQRGAAYS
jgi:hypothetical protein